MHTHYSRHGLARRAPSRKLTHVHKHICSPRLQRHMFFIRGASSSARMREFTQTASAQMFQGGASSRDIVFGLPTHGICLAQSLLRRKSPASCGFLPGGTNDSISLNLLASDPVGIANYSIFHLHMHHTGVPCILIEFCRCSSLWPIASV